MAQITTPEEYEAARRRLAGFRHMLYHLGVQLKETWGMSGPAAQAVVRQALVSMDHGVVDTRALFDYEWEHADDDDADVTEPFVAIHLDQPCPGNPPPIQPPVHVRATVVPD